MRKFSRVASRARSAILSLASLAAAVRGLQQVAVGRREDADERPASVRKSMKINVKRLKSD